MPLYMKMSQNINETTRHLKFCHYSILTNLKKGQQWLYEDAKVICKVMCSLVNRMLFVDLE